MANLSLSNQILAGQAMDPRPIQANFSDIETFINDEVFTTDGSKALTSPLTLAGPGTADGHATTKAQLDAVNDALTAVDVANAATAAAATAAAVVTAAADAKTKADAAAVKGTADAKTYTDSVKVYSAFAEDGTGPEYTTTSNTHLVLDTGNITPSKAGHAIITVTADIEVDSVGTIMNAFVGELHVDNVTQVDQMIWRPAAPTVADRMTMSQVWIVARPTADTFDVKFHVRHTGGNGGAYNFGGTQHSYIQCLMIG